MQRWKAIANALVNRDNAVDRKEQMSGYDGVKEAIDGAEL